MLRKREIDGIRIAGWTSGERWRDGLRHLVFIHGSGGDHTHWAYQLDDLKKDFNVLAVDLPGHGQSAGKGERSVEAYVEWIRGILAAFEVEKPILVGHSLGAAISLSFAIRYGDLSSGIVPVGGGAVMWVNPTILAGLLEDPRPIIEMAARLSLARGNRERFEKVLASGFARANPVVMQGDFSACNDLNLTAEVKKIAIPTLVVCGTEDRMMPPEHSRFLKDNIPGARMALIDNAGHLVMMEDPETFNRHIREFAGSL
ncbi:MAG: alpha/beta hydrolase [Pseudomonadota bacterium]|nr:alpha/beta hydrolase [Pseudomonadota bacterium]